MTSTQLHLFLPLGSAFLVYPRGDSKASTDPVLEEHFAWARTINIKMLHGATILERGGMC